MKKTMINGRKVGFCKTLRSAGVLALMLSISACASKRTEVTDPTTIEAGTESSSADTQTAANTETDTDPSQIAVSNSTAATEATSEAAPETKVNREEFVVKLADIKIEDYIDLTKVKDLQIKTEDTKVSDSVIKSEVIAALVSEMGFEAVEVDRPVQNGDTVNIDFEGSVDGVPFEGGTESGYPLVIGSGSFIPGFEDGIIGKKKNDVFDLPVTFPEDYKNPDLAGKNAVFKVTIHKITAQPEVVSDAEIQEKSGGKYETYQAFYDSIAAKLNKQNHIQVVFSNIMDAVEVKADHEGLINEYVNLQLERLDQLCAMYGLDRETILSTSGLNVESYTAMLKEEGKEYAKQKLTILKICSDNGYEFTDADIAAFKKKMIEENKLETEKDLMALATEDEILFQMNYDKFMDYLENYKTVD